MLFELDLGCKALMHSSEGKYYIVIAADSTLQSIACLILRGGSLRRVHVQLALRLGAPVVPQHHAG